MKLSYLILILFLLTQVGLAQDPSSWGQSRGDVLLTGAKLMVAPGQTVDKGNLHILNGRVAAIGPAAQGTAGSRKIDVSGLVIHAGFIDPYLDGAKVGLKKKALEQGTPVSGKHPKIHDDLRVVDTLDLKDDAFSKYRKLGFVAVGVTPRVGILRGQSAVYKTGNQAVDSELLLRESAYSSVGFETGGWNDLKGDNYPLSMMGCVALIRQSFLDADWYRSARSVPGFVEQKPPFSGNSESLHQVATGQRLLVGEAGNYLQTLRFLNLFQEIGVPKSAVVLSGQEWQQLTWLKNTIRSSNSFILPIAFPEDPKSGDGVSKEQLTLEVLRNWFAAPANPRWLAAHGIKFSFTAHGQKDLKDFPKRVQEAIAAGLSAQDALAALTTEPARLLGLESDFGTLQVGKSASFVIRDGGPFSGETVIHEVWVDGVRYPDYNALAKGEKPKKEKVKVREFIKSASYSAPPTLVKPPFSPPSVLVKDVTLWTQDTGGVVKSADMLIQGGVIRAVGPSLSVPAGGHIVTGTGLHVTPGIVDAHSHTAVQGMVNEPGANITAMVRMKDVIDPFDHDIYLQLASGVTTVNILHGSANAIGGQSITCKWRLGSAPQDMVFQGVPEGIKFALGENPKQSNWGDKHQSRYPQSRMGVVELIRGAFVSARNYGKLKGQGKNPKPDLLLEALLEVLDGSRTVHCHSYRQDEILALIRAADEVGFKVNVFQHVLEGYKVADEIAKHGASASTFADWWAYKVEVEDAIPYNASLMAEAGVMVSINSDSDDLARRLNTEAAKSIRYGGMSEVDALNLITRNGADQLGALSKIGTLTQGKDADFVVWSQHPLTQGAVVLETWIDGKRYFQRALEPDRLAAQTAERERYLSMIKSKKEEEKEEKDS
jgi:imidazolonepropionase-like amidohydrolase